MSQPPRAAPPRSSIWALIALVLGLIVLLIGATVWARADRTLRTVQQADPRARTAPADAAPTLAASVPTLAPLPPQTTPSPNLAPSAPTNPPTVAVPSVEPTGEPTTAPATSTLKPFTLLLLGVDRRPDDVTDVRTDTIIVARVDPEARWVSLLSIPRDTVATVPGFGPTKINAAFTIGAQNAVARYGAGTQPDAGGAALAAETVENYLGVPVDYTAQVDFRGFAEVVDTLGGVLVDVQRPLLDPAYPTEDYGVERLYIPAGLQVLDGKQALAFARTRHDSNDFGRSARQQQILRALLDEVRARGLLENTALIDGVLNVAERRVRTTLPISDLSVLRGLIELGRNLPSERVAQFAINPQTVVLDGEVETALYWNRASVRTLVRKWQAGPSVSKAR